MLPAQAHFVWMGPSLPWAYVLAIRSAAIRGELDGVTLHHTDALNTGPGLDLLEGTQGVRLARLDPLECARQVGAELGLDAGLTELYARVQSPVARSNILRAALLHLLGGIYLDLDTVTVKSLRPLLVDHQFVGCEHIVWPRSVLVSSSRLLRYKSLALSSLRDGLRRLPRGYRYFRGMSGLYYHGINGAIVGAEPRAPLMAQYLQAMVAEPQDRQQAKHGLGTHLLQLQVEGYTGQDLKIHTPDVFYPLPPEIAEHWFRLGSRPRLDEALYPTTHVVHWYASARAKPFVEAVCPDYIRQHAHRQLYSALVEPFLN